MPYSSSENFFHGKFLVEKVSLIIKEEEKSKLKIITYYLITPLTILSQQIKYYFSKFKYRRYNNKDSGKDCDDYARTRFTKSLHSFFFLFFSSPTSTINKILYLYCSMFF